MAVANSILVAWFFSSVLWAKGEGVVLKETSDEKMYGHSLSIIFLVVFTAFLVVTKQWLKNDWLGNVCSIYIHSNARVGPAKDNIFKF